MKLMRNSDVECILSNLSIQSPTAAFSKAHVLCTICWVNSVHLSVGGFGSKYLPIVLCLAQPEAVSQAKWAQIGQARLGHNDSFMAALAWPGVLKSQSQAVKPWLFGEFYRKFLALGK